MAFSLKARKVTGLRLSTQLQIAQQVVCAMPSDEIRILRGAIDEGTATFAALHVHPKRVQAAIGALEEAISGAVQRAAVFEPSQRRIIERVLIEDTRSLLDAQRAWFLQLSVEAAPEQVPELRKALRVGRSR